MDIEAAIKYWGPEIATRPITSRTETFPIKDDLDDAKPLPILT